MAKFVQKIKNQLTTESKLLFKNSSWVFISNLIKVIFIFFKSILITQALGLKLYGDYITIFGLILTIQAFFNVNFGTVIIKFGSSFIAENKIKNLKSLLKLAYLSSFISVVLSVCFITVIVFFTRYIFNQNSDQEWNVVLLSFTFGLSFFDYISESYLRLQMKFKLTSMLTVLCSFIDLSLTAIVALLFFDDFSYFLYGIAFSKLISSLIYNLVALYFMKKTLKGNIFEPIKTIQSEYKAIIHFISSNYGSRLLKNLVEQGDVLVLGLFSTQSEVGIYAVGKRVGYAILSFIDPLVNAIFPQFTKLIAEKKFVELYEMIKQFSKIIFIPAILILILTFFIKDDLIIFLYGKEFLASSNVFYVILIAALVASVTFWNITLLISLNALNYRFKMNIFILIYGLTLSYLIIPHYGAMGAAFILLSIKFIESGFGSLKSLVILKKSIPR